MTSEEETILKSVTAKLTGEGFYVGQRVYVSPVCLHATVTALELPPHKLKEWARNEPENRMCVRRDGDKFDTYPLRRVCTPA